MKIKAADFLHNLLLLSRELLKIFGVALLSLSLSSCILGRADRSNDTNTDSQSDDDSDTDSNTEGPRKTPAEDIPSGGEDAYDQALKDTTLFSFEFDIQLNGSLSFDDRVIAKSVSLSQPRLDDFDKDDRYGNEFNSENMASQEWDNRDRAWVTDNTIPFNGSEADRNYYLLNQDASEGDNDTWTEIEDNNARRLSVLEGDIYENHLGVEYFWHFKTPKNLDNEPLDSHLKQLVFHDIYHDPEQTSSNTDNTLDDSNTREAELLDWIDDVEGSDEDFPSGAEKYIVIKYVLETVYVVEQTGHINSSYRFDDVGSGVSDLASLAVQFATAGASFIDFDLTVTFSLGDGDLTPTASIAKNGKSYSGTTEALTFDDQEVWLINIDDKDKYALEIPYDIDIFLAQPTGDGKIYFGKRYNKTIQEEVEKEDTTPEGHDFEMCLEDFHLVDQREDMTNDGRAYKLYSCPQQHIFFNDTAIEAIKEHLKNWRDEEYEDDK